MTGDGIAEEEVVEEETRQRYHRSVSDEVEVREEVVIREAHGVAEILVVMSEVLEIFRKDAVSTRLGDRPRKADVEIFELANQSNADYDIKKDGKNPTGEAEDVAKQHVQMKRDIASERSDENIRRVSDVLVGSEDAERLVQDVAGYVEDADDGEDPAPATQPSQVNLVIWIRLYGDLPVVKELAEIPLSGYR